jgi:hypothetical protein
MKRKKPTTLGKYLFIKLGSPVQCNTKCIIWYGLGGDARFHQYPFPPNETLTMFLPKQLYTTLKLKAITQK